MSESFLHPCSYDKEVEIHSPNPEVYLGPQSVLVCLVPFRTMGIQELSCIGGFFNRRVVYSWEGETLEVDETCYDHGTLYEIECETVS
jgi:hypothetical protein